MGILRFSVSKKSGKPAEEIFSRIDSIEKVLGYEKEFEEYILESDNKKTGAAYVRVRIFGKEIRGRMNYMTGKNSIEGVVSSSDIKHLKFGYRLKRLDKGSVATQFAELDTGSSIKNFFVKVFFSTRIKKHMEKEVLELIK